MFSKELYKETINPDSVQTAHHYWGYPADPDQWSASKDSTVSKSHSWKRGYAISNFHARKAAGELLPHTPFEKVEYESKYTSGPIEGEWSRIPNDIVDSSTSDLIFERVGDSFMREEVKEACNNYAPFVQASAAKINSYGFDALTALAELADLRRTWDLLSTKALRAKHTLGDKFEVAWLGGRYGLRPLYYDFLDFNEAISKRLGKLSRYSERTGASTTWENIDLLGDVGLAWGRPATVHSRIKTDVDLSLRGSVTADIKLDTFKFDPLQTGWEIVPYSFVIDWFVGVGQALNAINFVINAEAYQASGGWKVTILRESETLGFPVSSNPDYSVKEYAGTKLTEKVTWETRYPTSVSITPFGQFNMDIWKGVDLFLLARQLIKR